MGDHCRVSPWPREPEAPDAGGVPPQAAGYDAATATTGATVLSGGAWKAASLLLPQLYALIQSIVAARFLGPAGMGVQSFIAFTELSVVNLLTVGLSISLMRYIGELLGRRRGGEVRDLLARAPRVRRRAADGPVPGPPAAPRAPPGHRRWAPPRGGGRGRPERPRLRGARGRPPPHGRARGRAGRPPRPAARASPRRRGR